MDADPTVALTPVLQVAALVGYLFGSIPWGLLLTRLAGKPDPRTVGSGNIGTTNVLRAGGKGLAAATLVLDAAKGAVPALIMAEWSGNAALIAGFFAVLGHNFPIWLKFRGGKGVATTLGVLLAWAWPAGLIALAVWIGVAVLTRYSSLAALVTLVQAPFALWAFAGVPAAVVGGLLTLLGFARHHRNIRNLVRGEESRISLGSKSKSSGGDGGAGDGDGGPAGGQSVQAK